MSWIEWFIVGLIFGMFIGGTATTICFSLILMSRTALNSARANAPRSIPAGGVSPWPSTPPEGHRSATALVAAALVCGVIFMSIAIAKQRSAEVPLDASGNTTTALR